jgi:IS5 family transposase
MQSVPSSELDQGDLFRSRLDQMLDRDHSLFRLAEAIDWSVFEKEFAAYYCADNGRPALPIRLMVGLHYLKHLFNVSDETVVATWVENPYWQYFCGETYFVHKLPCDPTVLVKWRRRVGADGLEKLLQETLEAAKRAKLLHAQELKQVNVDTTVQEKAIAFPTDARLYHKARKALVRAAKSCGLSLRQSYQRLGPRALQQQGRYSAARQGRRAQRETRRLRTYLGRVIRDLQRQIPQLNGGAPKELEVLLARAERIYNQQRQDRNKLYSVHAPEVECIAKGKVHKKYEFGVKVQVVTTSKQGWIVAMDAVHGNPYDGETLRPALEQMQRVSGAQPTHACVDRGFKGGKHHPPDVEVLISGRRSLPVKLKKLLRRRAAIEPIIGHAKSDHRLDRNYLMGKDGDRINAMLSACGFNLRKLMNNSHKLKKLWRLFLQWLAKALNQGLRARLLKTDSIQIMWQS